MAVVLAGLALLTLIAICVMLSGGNLVYTLDDPYIHLALAHNIQLGSYGINLGEWSSPSSSILWPFLLALFPLPQAEWAPLAINTLCCLVTTQLLFSTLRETVLRPWQAAILAVGVSLGLNHFGLVMTGMEHSLQVMLVTFVATALVRGTATPLTYVAIVLAALVRYECLVIALPVLLYLGWQGDRSKALLTGAVLAAAVLGFSWWLHSLGLPWLPCSVLVKNSATVQLGNNWQSSQAVALLLAWLLYHYAKQGKRLDFLCLAVVPVLGFMVLGKSGWFGRYEVFINTYLVVLALGTLRPWETTKLAPSQVGSLPRFDQSPGWVAAAVLAVSLSFPSLLMYTPLSPLAARNVYQQQVVMAQIAHDVGEPVAVNDLGLVALRSGNKVLDLWGLGSFEAFKARRAGTTDAAWIENIMSQQGTRYAFVYESWFAERPGSWIKVGELTLKNRKVSVADSKVALFATTAAAAEKLRGVLNRTRDDPRLAQLVQVLPSTGAPGQPVLSLSPQ